MTRITRAITGELLWPLLAGTGLFCAILSFGYFMVSSQWLEGVPLGLIAQWLVYQLPDTLVKVLPMGVVVMTVVAYGRLSAARELLAIQAGGLGLGVVVQPALWLGLICAVLSGWLSLWVAPEWNVKTRALYWDTLTGEGLSQLSGKTVDLGEMSLFIKGYDPKTRDLLGVRVQQWPEDEHGRLILAEKGQFDGRKLILRNYRLFDINYRVLAEVSAGKRSLLKAREHLKIQPSGKEISLDTGMSREQVLAQYADALGADAQGWKSLRATINDPHKNEADKKTASVTLQRKLAIPFANLVLVLAALPFAVRFGRTLGVSLGLAVLIAISYYLVFALGLTFGRFLPIPELGVWFANLVFGVGGIWLLTRR